MRRRGGQGRQPLGAGRLLGRMWRVAAVAALAASTLLLLGDLIGTRNGFLFDFKGDLYNGLVAILHGRNPYQAGYVAHLAALKRAHHGINVGFAVPTKPAPILLGFLPFGMLPVVVSGVIFVLLSIAAIVLGLRLLGVRDWRCYAVALVAWPTVFGLYLGNASPILFLGVAVLWRWRARTLIPAAAAAGVVLMKVFPWPLVVWLAITRRWRTFLLTLVIGGAAAVIGWAVIGFAGMASYPKMLSDIASAIQGNGPSFYSFLLALGVGAAAAKAGAFAAGAGLLALAWRISRHPEGERHAFGLAVVAALFAAPNIWGHYLVLLFIPIALLSPQLSAIWFVPVLTGEIPTVSAGNVGQMLFWVAAQASVALWICWTGRAMLPIRWRASAQAMNAKLENQTV